MAMADPTARDADLVLAGLHLRLGALALARAELETLAGRDALDDDGLTDLAEVRWRTGDLVGAGEAAAAILDGDDGPVVALVVAAEAAMGRGRPSEARRYADRATARAGASLDALFAGMPRSPIWPADPAVLPIAAASLFDVPAVGPASGVAAAAGGVASAGSAAAATAALSIGLWDADPDAAAGLDDGGPDLPIGGDELVLARAALDDGQAADAAVHLALVVRLTPALAPAVLELIGDDRRPELALVRGDAYRLVGLETEARQAYADVPRPAPRAHPSGVDQPDPTSPIRPRTRRPRVTERTLVLIKPDGVQRQLTGRILARYEERGLKVVGLKLVQVRRETAEQHYDAHREKPFFVGLVDFITSAPLVALALEGPNAIAVVRAINGATRPHEAAPGTIRGDFALETAQNIVHASDGPEAAATELALWFDPSELLDYERDVDRWVLAPAD